MTSVEETAKGLKQYQRDALTVLRARIDPNDSGFVGTDEVRAAIRAIGPYLTDTLSLIDVAAGGGYYGQREYVARDAARVRTRRKEKADKPT